MNIYKVVSDVRKNCGHVGVLNHEGYVRSQNAMVPIVHILFVILQPDDFLYTVQNHYLSIIHTIINYSGSCFVLRIAEKTKDARNISTAYIWHQRITRLSASKVYYFSYLFALHFSQHFANIQYPGHIKMLYQRKI